MSNPRSLRHQGTDLVCDSTSGLTIVVYRRDSPAAQASRCCSSCRDCRQRRGDPLGNYLSRTPRRYLGPPSLYCSRPRVVFRCTSSQWDSARAQLVCPGTWSGCRGCLAAPAASSPTAMASPTSSTCASTANPASSAYAYAASAATSATTPWCSGNRSWVGRWGRWGWWGRRGCWDCWSQWGCRSRMGCGSQWGQRVRTTSLHHWR